MLMLGKITTNHLPSPPHHAQYTNQSCWNGLESRTKASLIFNSQARLAKILFIEQLLDQSLNLSATLVLINGI